MSFGIKRKQKNYFKYFHYYNVLIEKPKIKHLSNIELLHEYPFHDQLSVA